MRTIFILHNIRSAQNVGAVFRTADAVGVDRMILTGYTPTPIDVFKRENSRIAKTALGAEKTVPWEHYKDISEVVTELQRVGTTVVAVEQDDRARDYRDFSPPGDTAFIFGNEVDGISPEVLDTVDEIIELPMRGSKESLNVSVAAGVIGYRFLR